MGCALFRFVLMNKISCRLCEHNKFTHLNAEFDKYLIFFSAEGCWVSYQGGGVCVCLSSAFAVLRSVCERSYWTVLLHLQIHEHFHIWLPE